LQKKKGCVVDSTTSSVPSGGMNLSSTVSQLVAQSGGVSGLIQSFEQKGLGGVVQSWIGSGTNQSVSSQQVGSVFGLENIAALASKSGILPSELQQKLAEFLPSAVDKMTPEGKVPAGGFNFANLESVAASFLR
jgi:uncharacterized protein YidB (DUF937 family)